MFMLVYVLMMNVNH